MSKIETAVTELISERLESLGFELWDVSFFKNHEGWNLSIEVDREGGVDMDAVSVANEHINELLDEADLIKDPYILEVASAGLDRELKNDRQRNAFLGKTVTVKLYAPLDGAKQFVGTLVSALDGGITLEIGDKTLEIEKAKLASVKIDLLEATPHNTR